MRPCQIVPLRAGGGTRLTILNEGPWARRWSARHLCRGDAAVARRHNILIRDDPKEFANAMLSVLRDEGCAPAGRARPGHRGTTLRGDVIGNELTETYMGSPAGPGDRRPQAGGLEGTP